MRMAACCATVLMLLMAGSASAEALVSQGHHYRAELPAGWERVAPTVKQDFLLRPVGSTTPLPVITSAYEEAEGAIDPAIVEKNLKTGLQKEADKIGVTLILERSNYNPMTQLITIDFRIIENLRTTKRSTLACRVGDHTLVGFVLTSYPLTYELYKSDFMKLVNSIQLDRGYEMRTAGGSTPAPVVQPSVQPQPEPSVETPPAPTAPARRQPAEMMPYYVLGGALCTFSGAVLLMLALVGILAMMSRQKKPSLAV